MQGSTDNQATVVSLLKRLSEVYCVYREKDIEQRQKKRGIKRLFRRWFVSFDPTAVDSEHQTFLDDVESIVAQLSTALEELQRKDPDMCKGYAADAAGVILAPKHANHKTTAEWYMMIAEYQCAVLLPWLATDDLKRMRDEWLKRTPKRMMYPKQRELLKEMEKLITS